MENVKVSQARNFVSQFRVMFEVVDPLSVVANELIKYFVFVLRQRALILTRYKKSSIMEVCDTECDTYISRRMTA